MKPDYSSKTIIKNVSFNLLGFFFPLLFALLFIPVIIKELGSDKFGVLNLAWIVIGYFGFFDLGIGRALTKITSEKIGKGQLSEIPFYFWTSFFLMFAFSSFISIVVLFFSETLILKFFKIPHEIQQETINAFYILLLAIPFVTTSAAIRGLLEAYQRFDLVNVIRIILGISSFLSPALVLIFSNNLFWIILLLVIFRILIWFFYLFVAFKQNPILSSTIRFNINLIKPIFKLSSWMTISNITVPINIYIDRILVASLISATALTYYATPYEIISKLLVIPSALTAVLFPTFASNYFSNPAFAIKLSEKAIKYISLILFPIIFLIVIFSFELLSIWLGNNFAINSHLILQIFSIGIFFNSIAFIPFSFIEGIGRPDVTAKIQLLELPFYILFMLLAINKYSIQGAALVFMFRMLFDCLLLIYFSKKIVNISSTLKFSKIKIYILFILIFISVILVDFMLIIKIIISILFLFLYSFISWRYLLDNDDKIFIISKVKTLL